MGTMAKIDDSVKKKVPELRFAGFADDWEERKFFENIASTIDFRGRTPKKLGMDWSDSGYLALSALNVKNGYIDPLADAHYGDEKLYRKWMSGRELKKGQVLFTTEAPMGNVAQVPDDNGYILSQRTVAFETKEDMMTNDFLAVLLKSPLVFNNLSALSSGGTAKGVSQKSLKGLSITVPLDIDEQQKIGSFFKQLDETIALHQRKLDLLKEQKKGYLQKMFPKNGAKVPELRFAGFADDWELRKVGELLTERNEQAPMNDEFPLMAFIANEGVAPKGERYDRSSLVNDTAGKLYKKTRFGDFIYSSNNLETGSIGLNKYGNASVSPVYSIFEATGIADSDFIGRRLVRKDFINAMIKWRQGVVYGQWKIHESDFVKIEVAVPSVDEQRQIGEFLDTLDQQITLHQRKLDKLKSVKQAYLSEMFPAEGERVPKRRFPGFTDAWELRKLGEVADIIGGGTPSTSNSEFWDGDIDWYTPAEIGEQIYVDGSERKITQLGLDKSSATLLPANKTILFTSRAGIGKTAILRSDATTNQGFQSIVVDNNTEPYFIFSMTDKIKNKAISVASGSTFAEISSRALGQLEFMFPSINEQKAIGTFFSTLDQHITLHQRKS